MRSARSRAVLVPAGAVVASSLLLWLFASVAWPWALAGFVALVPYLLALEDARTWRAAVALGLGVALGFVILVVGWFPASLAAYSGAPLATCWAAVVVASPFLEPQLVAHALVYRFAVSRRAGPGTAHAAAALAYVGAEWAWPKLFGDTLGYGLYPFEHLRQAADLAGVRGLTLLVLAVNAALALALGRVLAHPRPAGSRAMARAAAPALAALVALAAVAGYGALRLSRVEAATTGELSVGLVQANFTAYDKRAAEAGTYAVVQRILDDHFRLSAGLLEGGPLDLLVWPETVYPTTFGAPKSEEGAEFDRAIAGFVARTGTPLLFGTYDRDGDREYNAAVLLRPAGEGRVEMTAYHKALLFPLTEHVPAWLDGALVRRLLPWTGHWSPGEGPDRLVLERPGDALSFAPLICYEAVSPGFAAAAARPGADAIVSLSNDAWFADSPAPRLHLVIAAFRSIETRLPQARATTTGISAVIDAGGTILAAATPGRRTSLRAAVPRTRPLFSLARAWGDWLGPVALVLAAGACGWILARARRSVVSAERRVARRAA